MAQLVKELAAEPPQPEFSPNQLPKLSMTSDILFLFTKDLHEHYVTCIYPLTDIYKISNYIL